MISIMAYNIFKQTRKSKNLWHMVSSMSFYGDAWSIDNSVLEGMGNHMHKLAITTARMLFHSSFAKFFLPFAAVVHQCSPHCANANQEWMTASGHPGHLGPPKNGTTCMLWHWQVICKFLAWPIKASSTHVAKPDFARYQATCMVSMLHSWQIAHQVTHRWHHHISTPVNLILDPHPGRLQARSFSAT